MTDIHGHYDDMAFGLLDRKQKQLLEKYCHEYTEEAMKLLGYCSHHD